MGKNKKTANRTKKNSQKAKSQDCADLLGSDTVQQINSSSFLARNEEGVLIPTLPGFTAIADLTILDMDYQQIFRNMKRKSEVTRLKSLQEFSKAVSTASIETMQQILPFWSNIFLKTLNDRDQNVRMGCIQSQLAIIKHSLLKNTNVLVDHLKNTFPSLWMSQFIDNELNIEDLLQQIELNIKLDLILKLCEEDILKLIESNLTKDETSCFKLFAEWRNFCIEYATVNVTSLYFLKYRTFLENVTLLKPDQSHEALKEDKFIIMLDLLNEHENNQI